MNRYLVVLPVIMLVLISCDLDYGSETNGGLSPVIEFEYPEPNVFVGADREFKTPGEAAENVKDGDVVQIDPGTYTDTAVWRADNLTILGSRDGGVHLDASGVTIPNRKGIWVIGGNNTIVDNIEFSHAAVPDRNGAGIRQEGENLTVRNCYFHHNEMGILAGDNVGSEIIVEHSEFSYHGKANNGFSHNIYVNHIKKFVFRFNYSHHGEYGHTVKSRAYENQIMYNRIMDEDDGYSSYLIDLPNGGRSYIIGNILHQGQLSDNTTMISYGAEGASNPLQELYVCNNTFVNDRSNGRGIRIAGNPSDVKIVNNIFDNLSTAIVNPVGNISNNLEISNCSFIDRSNYNFRLQSNSPAIDSGDNNVFVYGENIIPEWEYMEERDKTPRVSDSIIDIGAFEY